jgi:hypothetical protein
MTRQMFKNVTAPDPALLVALEKSKKKPAGSGKFEKTAKGVEQVDPRVKECIEQQRCHLAEAGKTHEPRPEAGPDRECWVRDQVMTAIRMGIALAAAQNVRADRSALECGLRGVAEGASIEILGTLGFDLHKLVNLRRIYGPDLLC